MKRIHLVGMVTENMVGRHIDYTLVTNSPMKLGEIFTFGDKFPKAGLELQWMNGFRFKVIQLGDSFIQAVKIDD